MTVDTQAELARKPTLRDRIRWGVSWCLYALGHVASLPMVAWDWAFLYPLYNRLMAASADLQGDGARGPWQQASCLDD